jgi:Ca2+-binding EF-hand superfamily protein
VRVIMRMTFPCLCVALLTLSARADDQSAATQPNVEQSSMHAANQKFKALDRNHDQYISLEEARKDPELMKRFASADTNGDGKLDQAEFQSKPSEKPAG